MSILIATPGYGGQVHLPYFHSCMNLKEEFLNAGIEHDWLTNAHESSITRARNTMASTFMKTDYEALLFIDADIEFQPEDVAKLWNHIWNKDVSVAVGVYPMKRIDSPLTAWRDGKRVSIEGKTEDFEVDFAGTGFMMIHRSLIEDMMQIYEGLKYEENDIGECYALFDTMVWNGIFLTEDYAFCHRVRAMDRKILCDPTIKLIHHGQYAYGK